MFNKYLFQKLIMVFLLITFAISMDAFFEGKSILSKFYYKNNLTNISSENILSLEEMIKLKGALAGMPNHECVYGTPSCIVCIEGKMDSVYVRTLENSPVCEGSPGEICDHFDYGACRIGTGCTFMAGICVCWGKGDEYKISMGCYY